MKQGTTPGSWELLRTRNTLAVSPARRLVNEKSAQAAKKSRHLPEPPHPPPPLLLSSSLRALKLRFLSLTQGALLSLGGGSLPPSQAHPTSPPPSPPPWEREPGIPRPCTIPGARTGPGAAGRQSPCGGEAGARLRRAGGACWRCFPREPQTLAQTQTDAQTGGQARGQAPTEFPGRLRSEARASPGPGSPPFPAGSRRRQLRSRRRRKGGRAGGRRRGGPGAPGG